MNTVCRMMYLLLAVLPLLFAFGCGKASAPQETGYTVTDAQGRAVAFEKSPCGF